MCGARGAVSLKGFSVFNPCLPFSTNIGRSSPLERRQITRHDPWKRIRDTERQTLHTTYRHTYTHSLGHDNHIPCAAWPSFFPSYLANSIHLHLVTNNCINTKAIISGITRLWIILRLHYRSIASPTQG